MRIRKLIAIVICGFMAVTNFNSVAYANPNHESNNTKKQPTTMILKDENDKSFLDGYEVLNVETFGVYPIAGPVVPGGEDIIKTLTKDRVFNYTMTGVVIGSVLAQGVSFIPHPALKALCGLATPIIAAKISSLPNVYTRCVYYHLRGADGKTRYALSVTNYRNSNFTGYIDGSYQNVDPYGN